MSKELEALEDIILYLNANEPKGLYCSNIEIIKTALKNYEKILFHFDIYPKVLNTETKLEALQIIGKKGVNIYFLKETDNADEYNELIKSHLGMKTLGQEEYDLLKEMLL